jgi:hypothetical protein
MTTVSKQVRGKEERPITATMWRIGESELPERWRRKLGLSQGATWFDGVVMGLFHAAINGNPEAAREIREAIVGKAPLCIELTVDAGMGRGNHSAARELREGIEGKLTEKIDLTVDVNKDIVQRLMAARKRVAQGNRESRDGGAIPSHAPKEPAKTIADR